MNRLILKSVYELKVIKYILLISLVITLISIGLGFYMSASSNAWVVSLKQDYLSQIKDFEVLNTISEYLMSGKLVLAILITFLFNLISGAFISTTLTGIIFPLPLLIAFQRGVMVGMIYGGVEGNFWYYLVLSGTFILEFSAYIISTAVGVNLGLSFFNPKRFKTKSRWKAFVESWKQTLKIYPLIALILLVSAIWEIGGIYLMLK